MVLNYYKNVNQPSILPLLISKPEEIGFDLGKKNVNWI